MPSSWQRLAAALVGLLLLHEIACIAIAATGGQVTLPAPSPTGVPAPNKSGLTIAIDTVWLPANGYRPVRITIAPIAPITADRTLQIRLTPIGATRAWALGLDIQVTRTLEIPAGSSGATTTIPVPQWEPWQALQLDVFEDGQRVNELSAGTVFAHDDVSNGYGANLNSPTLGETPAILLLGATGNDVVATRHASILQTSVPPNWPTAFGIFRSCEFLSAGANEPAGVATRPSIASVAGLPDQWLGYSGVDIVLVPLDKLHDLVKNHSSQWAAIRRAVAAGGNLCVYDIGDEWQRLSELEELVGLQLPFAEEDATKSRSLRYWKKPDPKPQDPQVPAADSLGDKLNDASASANPAQTPKPTPPPPFVSRALGRGQIVAISAANLFADEKFDWNWLLLTIGENRWQWSVRSGVVLDPDELESNATNFWQFLIPGVGITPVLQFQILISLFVIVIGPVNYFLLRRWQRLNLLPITVGMSAAVVTLSLFAYAFIHDGFRIRVRARSFTELDQRRGEAVCWSRLSYYAGLSPSRGLTFSGDVAVYPMRTGIDRPSMSRGSQLPPPREMQWVEAEPNAADPLPSQHFPSDWLPARVPTQFVTVRARKTAARLTVALEGLPGHVSKIENHLGARIRSLVLTDAAGNAFAAEGIRDDESATVKALESSAAHARIARLILENGLESPAGAQSSAFQAAQRYSTYSPMNRYGQSSNVPSPSEAETVIERSLNHASDLPPRTFVAITETSPEVELGVSSAREESSLHVVVGSW